MSHIRIGKRRGASVVEAAIVLPVAFILLFGLLIGAIGIHRYQEVAYLAREGARWASVHGLQYELSTGKAAATPSDVYNNAIAPKAIGMDKSLLSYEVTWDPNKRQNSNVTVRVTYQWIPKKYFGGVALTSTSVMPVTY